MVSARSRSSLYNDTPTRAIQTSSLQQCYQRHVHQSWNLRRHRSEQSLPHYLLLYKLLICLIKCPLIYIAAVVPVM